MFSINSTRGSDVVIVPALCRSSFENVLLLALKLRVFGNFVKSDDALDRSGMVFEDHY